jgi:hypothetical protein
LLVYLMCCSVIVFINKLLFADLTLFKSGDAF